MKLEQSFDVAAPLQRVWEALIDVEHVAPCLPGASVTSRNEDGSYNGAFKVKIGPTSASYSGKLEMQQVDEQAHSATMQAHGTDKRGQGGAKAMIFSQLSPIDGEATHVEVVTDYHITGRLARFGRGGMIEDISERLLREFAQCLQNSLAGDGGPSVAGEGAATVVGGVAGVAGYGAATVVGEGAATVVSEDVAGQGEMTIAGEAEGSIAGEDAEPAGQPTARDDQPKGAGVSSDRPEADRTAPQPEAAQTPQTSEPVHGISLVASVLWARVRRNPTPAVAAVIGFLLAVVLLRRPRR
jgi:carbon monoxide dehydrogenase subunit G